MVTALVFDIQTGLGNTEVTIWLNLAWLAALLPALWIGANTGGIGGAAIGARIVAFVVAIPLAGWCCTGQASTWGRSLRRIVRPVLAAWSPGSRWPRSPTRSARHFAAAGGGRRLGIAVYLVHRRAGGGAGRRPALVVTWSALGRGAA